MHARICVQLASDAIDDPGYAIHFPSMIKLLRENVSFVITVMIVAGIWLALRTTATDFGPDSSFDSLLSEGEPVVVEFFGNT